MELLQAFDLYMRHTDAAGNAVVREHRVHDKEAFIAARKADAERANQDAPPKCSRLASAEQITREQYLRERTK